MSYRFSENLIERTINHFKKKYDLSISSEEADCYLASFALVFRSYVQSAIMDDVRTNVSNNNNDFSTGSSNTRRTLPNAI